MIMSLGYRVKSKRGTEFRKWATKVLRRHVINRAEHPALSPAQIIYNDQRQFNISIRDITISKSQFDLNDNDDIVQFLLVRTTPPNQIL